MKDSTKELKKIKHVLEDIAEGIDFLNTGAGMADNFAKAAFQLKIVNEQPTPEKAVQLAYQVADLMVEENAKRRSAASERLAKTVRDLTPAKNTKNLH